ncbi:hypothetical protein [Streptomyces sp. NPDC056160]|uniref:hypothetical protein n=1 Tax=Streptomyces sp. NPDC056160 TaxID=3345731 RepID=UPI0035D85235
MPAHQAGERRAARRTQQRTVAAADEAGERRLYGPAARHLAVGPPVHAGPVVGTAKVASVT